MYKLGSFDCPPCVKKLIVVHVAISLLQLFVPNMISVLGLVPEKVLSGSLWLLFTYQFFHGGLIHLFFNMFALWMFGQEIEKKWGSKRFLRYYLVCGVGAGLFIFLVPIILGHRLDIPTVGASGSIFGLMLAYAVLWPNREVLLWFVIPVKMKYLMLLIGGVSFIFLLQNSSNISHVGHFGGIVTGYLYLLMENTQTYYNASRIGLDTMGTIKNRVKKVRITSNLKYGTSNRSIEEETDILLEKIHREGLHSLSDSEKKFLLHVSKRLQADQPDNFS